MGQRESAPVEDKVREIVRASLRGKAQPKSWPSKALWAQLRACGSDLWLDTGDIDEASSLWCREFTALTTNNALLNREVQKGIYDDLVAQVACELRGQVAPEDLVLEIAFVLNAHHGLRLSREFGARVSVELHTDLARDVERSVRYGRRYFEIAPESFYVKVPLTPEGLLAARRLGDQGVPVNFTLGFSARQNYLITAVARPAFVNVFLGRLNSFVADHGLGAGAMVGEKATLASQRAVRSLRAQLGVGTRQIAASMREGSQVLALAGVDVLTMPPAVARQFEELSPPAHAVSSQLDSAPRIELAQGVDRAALGLDVLWEVCEGLESAVEGLLDVGLERLDGPGICELLARRGFADLLPAWHDADLEAVAADGKMPRYERWRSRLARREVGLDALMTICGLQAFAAEQKAMDDRIRSML